MKPRVLVCVLATAVSFSLAAPASGQLQSYDDIAAACAIGENCQELVASAISQLQQSGLSAEELAEQLGQLAAALVEVAVELPQAERVAVVEALTIVAEESPDSSQASEILEVAEELESESPDDATERVVTSPS